MLAIEAPVDLTVEFLKCVADRAYFVDSYVQIKAKSDPREVGAAGAWMPFRLWPAQRTVISAIASGDHLVILKARQLGQTWLILACILWQMLFRPACIALLFSKRENEAWELLDRIKGMYKHLPPWLQSTAGGVVTDNNGLWQLGNGSEARAFPTTAGDSYTAQIALCDEFDLVDNQDELLNAVGPTVIESGQLILLSRVDKDKPLTAFKRLYLAAKAGTLARWRALFLSWRERPGRDEAWYAARVAESLTKDNTLDSVQEQYPTTDGEALAQKSGNKRLPGVWLAQCQLHQPALAAPAGAPAIPGLAVYAAPLAGHSYVIGADPAEGNPTSDESAACVVDKANGHEVATLAGLFQPEELAAHCLQLAAWYNGAGILPERNNHGHAFILTLHHSGAYALRGTDGKEGWLTTGPSKTLAYDSVAECLREGDAGIADLLTFTQLGSIEGATLNAPKGQHDDRAMAWVLAQRGRMHGGPAKVRHNVRVR